AIAGEMSAGDFSDRRVDARMDAKREAVAGRRELIEKQIEILAAIAHHMQNRSENLSLQICGLRDFENMRCDVESLPWNVRRNLSGIEQARRSFRAFDRGF